MKPISFLAAAIVVFVIPTLVFAQATRDFNWIPSGKIEMGNPEVEARFQYWADSPEIRGLALPYAGGPRITYKGRTASAEQFTIPVATWRGGPCKGALVIRKVWDTGLPETTFKVNVDGQDLADWVISKDEGPRRWIKLFYVVPESVMAPKDDRGNARMKGKATVSLKTEAPMPSYGYAFFVTKDWGILGDIGESFLVPLGPDSREWSKTPLEANYISGIAALGLGNHDEAIRNFAVVKAGGVNAELACLSRRMLRLAEYRKVAIEQPKVELSEECFRRHYLLGLYCSANGFWEEALEEFTKAVTANPTDAEATYRLAEAMEHNRMPIETWAPLMERAGDLYGRDDYNTVDVFVPIQTEVYEGRTGKFSKGSMDALYRDWRYVEQQVWGASRGAYKLESHFKVYGADDVKWIHEGWAIHPPEEEWGEWGTYDQSVITAQYGDSGACGPDVGFAGVGYAQVGPTRGWEVLMHEWNHEFDWTVLFGEPFVGYPVTHDSDGCGKQPIVNMGCGHRSSMFYYVTPANYLRKETSDPIVEGSHIRTWAIGGFTEFTMPKDLKGEALEKWLIDKELYTMQQVDRWKLDWQKQMAANQEKDEPQPMETWDERLLNLLKRYRILSVCSARNEEEITTRPGSAKFKRYESPEDFVDLMKFYGDAPEKAVVYAGTYVWSPEDIEVRMWLGMNDTMKVWVNGEQISTGRYYAVVNWADQNMTNMIANTADLKKGWNHIVAKIERGGGGWGFSMSLVTFENARVEGLKYRAEKPDASIARYQRPEVGKRYSWDEVKDDYTKLLPTLSDEDIRNLTGLKKFETDEHFFLFHVDEVEGSRVIAERDDNDRELNNYLNWDWEGAAAVRYAKGGERRDLIFVRPEYFEEYLRLLPSDAADNIIGTKYIDKTYYRTTPNRASGRYVLVVDGRIDGEYPLDELNLLEIKTE